MKEEPMATNARSFVKREGINPISVSVFTVFHAGAIASLFFFSWPAFFTALALYWVSLSLGIGMGYHRLLTHRSYKPPKCAPCPPSVLRQGWRPAHTTRWQMVESYRLDAGRRRDPLQYRSVRSLRTGHLQGSVLGLAFEV